MDTNEVIRFLCNEKNIMSCEACPYNEGHNWPETVLPCGQFHCWVSLHCSSEYEPEEEQSFILDDWDGDWDTLLKERS